MLLYYCDGCRFGGGPEVRFLRPCSSCLCSHEEIVRRQCREMNAFIIVSYNSFNFKDYISRKPCIQINCHIGLPPTAVSQVYLG